MPCSRFFHVANVSFNAIRESFRIYSNLQPDFSLQTAMECSIRLQATQCWSLYIYIFFKKEGSFSNGVARVFLSSLLSGQLSHMVLYQRPKQINLDEKSLIKFFLFRFCFVYSSHNLVPFCEKTNKMPTESRPM